jgi:ParB family chromosome partitioning protein
MTPMTFPRKRELKWVPTDKIVANDNNPRDLSEFSEEELSLLRRSIGANGVWNPVVITPYKGDTYKLIEGERRWTSAKLEGVKEIPAQVVPKMDDAQELATMYQMHSTWRGWKPLEEMAAIERLIEESPGKSDPELAEMLGISLQRFR